MSPEHEVSVRWENVKDTINPACCSGVGDICLPSGTAWQGVE